MEYFSKSTGKKNVLLNKRIKKETLEQVFSCGFCKIFKNTVSSPVAAYLVP